MPTIDVIYKSGRTEAITTEGRKKTEQTLADLKRAQEIGAVQYYNIRSTENKGKH